MKESAAAVAAAEGAKGPAPQAPGRDPDPDSGSGNPPSKIVQFAKSVWAFCFANWLIFAFGLAALLGYLFPRT